MTARDERLSRRAFLAGTGASALAVGLLTVGQSFEPLAPLALLAPRRAGVGPQGVPVNRTADAAGVRALALDPMWSLEVVHRGARHAFARDDLRGLGLVEAHLPIACVEGWSTAAAWRGVRMRDLLAAVGAPDAVRCCILSLEPAGPYAVTTMGPEYCADPATLVALELNGEPLDLDHGFPARIIAPGRPGVLQTKWLRTIEVLS